MKKVQILKGSLFLVWLVIQGCGVDDVGVDSTECDGKGTIEYQGGSEYKGECKKGKRDGQGVMTWNNGSKYNGHWRDDKRDGQGVMIYDWGATYDGEWKNDKKEGQGIMTYDWGDKYNGEWHNGHQYWDNSEYKIKTYDSGNFATLTIPKKHFKELNKINSGHIFNSLKMALSKFILSQYQDKFNHIVLVVDGKEKEYDYVGVSFLIRNNVKGIGKKIFDDSNEYGSDSILKSLIVHPKIRYYSSSYIHELLHQFSNQFIPTTYANHYSFSTGGVLGGFSNESLIQLGENRYQANYNGLDTFGVRANRSYQYSFLDLYLMGLASKDEVPVIKVARCNEEVSSKKKCPYWLDKTKGIFYANYIEDISIDELIKKHGKRVPSYENSPKNFRGMVVVVSLEELSRKELEEFDKKVKDKMNNFNEYTSERATLKFDDLFDMEK